MKLLIKLNYRDMQIRLTVHNTLKSSQTKFFLIVITNKAILCYSCYSISDVIFNNKNHYKVLEYFPIIFNYLYQFSLA